MSKNPPVLLSLSALARRASVHRAVPMRLVASGQLRPDYLLEIAGGTVPLFTDDKIATVLAGVRPTKSHVE